AAVSGTEVTPSIQNNLGGFWRPDIAAAILSDPVRRQQHVQAIGDLVVARGYSGIDVDYEQLPATSRNDFSAFITSLAARLHGDGRQLSVAVGAKTNSNTTDAYDYDVIGANADT